MKNHNLYLCFCLCIVLLIKCTKCIEDYGFNEKIKEYLSEKAQYIQENLLIRKTRTITHHEELSDIRFQSVRKFPNIANSRNTTNEMFFNLFGNTYTLIEDEVFALLKFHNNNSVSFRKIVNFPRKKGHILFIKATEYQELGIILIAFKNGLIQIISTFNEEKQQFELVQSINSVKVRNVLFFENQDQLYLIVSDNLADNVAKNSVFLWSSTFFRLIDTNYSNRVIGLTSFSCNGSEIIIILQSTPKGQVNSLVYKFQNGALKKHQELDTYYNTTQAIIFEAENETYVAGLTNENVHEVYWWSGENLLHWSTFRSESNIQKSFVTYRNNLPVILTVENNELKAYKACSKEISLLGKAVHHQYFKILDANVLSSIFVMALQKNNSIFIEELDFQVNKTNIPEENMDNPLLKCLKNLNEKLNSQRDDMRIFKKKKIQTEPAPIFDNFARSGAAAFSDPTSVSAKFIDSQRKNPVEELKLILTETEDRVKNLHPIVDEYNFIPENLILGGNVLIEGSVFTEQLDSTTIYIKSLNGHAWTPEQWLSYSKPQTISGPVTAEMILTKRLEITEEQNMFTDVLLKSGNQTITAPVTLNSLKTTEMYTPNINGIAVQDIYLKSHPTVVTGTKKFNQLDTNDLVTNTINQKNPLEVLNYLKGSREFNYDVSDHLYVDNLIVEEIDGINWNDFKNSVFRVGLTDTISGNLMFSEIHSDTLRVNTLNGVLIKDFLTSTTNQTIDADIEFNNVFAKEVIVNTVNGISISKEVARIVEGADIFIESPVRMDNLTTKDLELKNGADQTLFMKKGDHIIGTNESDFMQIYSGTVKIKGDLYLKDLNVEKFSLSGEDYSEDVLKKYWTLSTIQRIPRHVELLKGMEIKSLTTNKVNDVPFEDYMINNGDLKKPTVYHFENVTVEGNVILNRDEENIPNLVAIDEQAVKKFGTYQITGTKVFKNTLRVDDLETKTLDNILANEAVRPELPETGNFKNLIINGDVLSSNLSLNKLNGVDINELLQSTVYAANKNSSKIDRLDFDSIKVENLKVSNLNGMNVNEYIEKRNEFFDSKSISNVYIIGNVSIEEARNVSTINNHNITELLENDDDSLQGKEAVHFIGKTFVQELYAEHINDVHFKNLISRILYKHWNQKITAHYNFKHLKTNDLETSKIGDVTVDDLIDITDEDVQTIIAPKGVRFVSKTVVESLFSDGGLPCELSEAVYFIRNPPAQVWKNIVVNGNVTLMDDRCKLRNILNKAVRVDADNIITEPVTFSFSVSAKHVNVEKTINDINIFEILEDALMKEGSNEQIVVGENVFKHITTSGARVFNNTDVPIVNELDIAALDESIVYKNNLNSGKIITGSKTFFGGLQTEHFNAKKVSNVPTESIVDISSNKTVHTVLFDTVFVGGDLRINKVNGIDLNHFLNNRLLLNGSNTQETFATYFFDNVEIFDDIEVSQINGVKIEDVVFDEGLQVIPSSKKFINDVKFHNNIQVETINEIPLSEFYEKVVLSGENSTINGNVEILMPSDVNANIQTETINGFDIKNLEEIMHEDERPVEGTQIGKVVKRIERMLHESLDMVKSMPNEYMYIEKTKQFQISVPNTINAQAVDMNGQILIHLTGQESGRLCGLPDTCTCPMQHTMQISAEQSINDFYNKGSQRIFTFNDDNVTMHFITNSVSMNKNCRTHEKIVTNELSSLTWNTKTVDNNGSFIMYPTHFSGYISGADSFSINGRSYVLIGRYYDPVNDSHNLDCILIRLSHDKTNAEIIQKIQTNGVWTIHLFHTAQGVTLILGNVGDFTQSEDTNSRIYRFNNLTQQFNLLKTIPSYGATAAAGVAFGSDSLIVLAHKEQPLQILKYEPFYDNYFFFQSFQLNAPVIGMSAFYTGDVGITQAHLTIVTENSNYYIYTYRYVEGWILVSSGHLEGLKNLIPFNLNKQAYLFAPSKDISSLFTIVKFGSN